MYQIKYKAKRKQKRNKIEKLPLRLSHFTETIMLFLIFVWLAIMESLLSADLHIYLCIT